jgi:ArsR family transcriptional regulator, cadmium/lead-responsive transcriptional repressor
MGAMSEPVRLPDQSSAGSAGPFAVETKLFRGLADPARLGILLELRTAQQSAGQLATRLGLRPSNASNHLLCLLECGLVQVESIGRHNVYRLADPAVERLLDASAALLTEVTPAIEACLNYGPPSRRALRPLRRSASGRSDEAPSSNG